MIGILVRCKEDMEVINMNANFQKDTFYTLTQDNEKQIWIISREHIPVNVSNRDILNRHFEIK